MNNLADIIEKWILDKISSNQNDIIILKRNEIASTLDCAPSQVSYVLNTRFTANNGFLVKSKRGFNGFVKISKVPYFSIIYEQTPQHISPDLSFEQAISILEELQVQNHLTYREYLLLRKALISVYDYVIPEKRSEFLKSIFQNFNKTEI